MASTRITELGTLIASKTAIVNEYFVFHGIPTPSFDIHGPPRVVIPPALKEIAAAHADVLAATRELHTLMLGPTAMLMGTNPNDVVSLQAIYRYKIASCFPAGEEASFEEISNKCGLNEIDLRRILRHAMTNYIFQEPRKGVVAHTAASRVLAEDRLLIDYIGIRTEEQFPAASRTVDALTKYGLAHDPAQTGFSLANGTDVGLYEELQKHPERSRRFANAMTAAASRVPMNPVFDCFDWQSLGRANVVDVGGSYGTVSIGLAQRFPELSCTVQDFPDVVKEGAERLPEQLKEHITFMPYSILEEQPVKGADVYFFRAIFHNWPDAYCIKILRNQIPALKSGSRLIINDHYAPDPHTKLPMEERALRSRDLDMLAVFGARERGDDDWPGIFEEADPRFKIVSAKTVPPGSTNGMIEVIWES